MSKPSKEKYREFWINYYDKHDVYDSYGVCHKNQTHADKNKMKDRVELIHVIEYSAYQKQTEVIEVLREALEHVEKFCLCERGCEGFDYGETHPISGKPKAGKRWLLPFEKTQQALAKAQKLLGGEDE